MFFSGCLFSVDNCFTSGIATEFRRYVLMVAAETQEPIGSTVLRWYFYYDDDDFNDAHVDLRCYLCFFIFPISHYCAVLYKALGGWTNYWLGRPFVLANKREPFQHNHWHRPTLTFKDGLPAGFCRRCKCVPLLCSGFVFVCPPRCLVLLSLIVFVVRPLGEGWGSIVVGSGAAVAWRQWTS